MNTNNYANITLFIGLLCATLLVGCKNERVQPVNSEAILSSLTDTISSTNITTTQTVKKVVLKDNLMDRIGKRPLLSQFAHAIKTATLDSILKTEKGPFTIFAIVNEQEIAAAKPSNANENTAWPASYIINGEYSTPEIYKGFSSLMAQTNFTTYDQKQITIYNLRDTLFFKFSTEQRTAYLCASDLYASNGVVHIIKFLKD